MKHLIPVIVILLMVSTAFVGVGNQVEELLSNDGTIAYFIEDWDSGSRIIEIEFGGGDYIIMGNISGKYGHGTWTNDNKIIALEDGTKKLYAIDPNTCELEYIGSSSVTLRDLAYDSSNDVLWGISDDKFYEVNISNGNTTLIGSMGNQGYMMTIEYDQENDIMYGLEFNYYCNLYTIDTSTGNSTLIGPSGGVFYSPELGYDNDEEIMYCHVCTELHVRWELYKVNLTTGDFTKFYDMWDDDSTFVVTFDYIKYHPIALFNWEPVTPQPDEEIIFNASESYDPDGNITLYEWDWDNDGEYDESSNFPNATHSWSNVGHYQVILRVKDNSLRTGKITNTIIIENEHPNIPIIDGLKNGKIRKDYEYSFEVIDSDNDEISLFIDWGDGNSNTTGFIHSGTIYKMNHSWNKKAPYTIKARATDLHGYNSEWGYLEITMPHTFWWLNALLNKFSMLQRFLEGLI